MLSFEVLLINPELKDGISNARIGEFRDGLTTRNADILDETNSVIHSTNQAGADIEILAPDNEDVSLYKIF